MKTLIFCLLISAVFSVSARAQTAGLNIIPQPKSLTRLKGEFKFNYKTKIVAADEAGRRSAAILNELLMKNYGFKLEYTEKPQKQNAIVFAAQGFPLDKMQPESYGLTVSPKSILIIGTETGQFYALQTLMQILPVDFKGEAKLPAVDIGDAPRFSYRGMHLDVSRHFMPLEFVKKYIDLLAQYKFNQFHWHLTDDQGWRIEIKKYPKLTEIGSRRADTVVQKNFNPYIGDGVPVEGFYTQEQIKEVVAYAKARKINVIPEIELPGHASAALAAYPELGCKTDFQYNVQRTWGIFKEVFCPTDTTFKFLEDVLEETIALFPDSPYIHIGGDEVLKDHWKESAFVQDLMKRENLKDEHEVQSYFIRRIERFVNSKGKRIIGWDEILEGGLAPNATVMSWRGEKGGIEAAKAKHDVIMTPTDYLYFDYGQGDPRSELQFNIGGYVPLEKVYSYNPHPKELNEDEKKYVLGAQANVWAEYLKKPENVEYMVFPRMLALAEVVWSPNESKNYADFQRRLGTHFARLDRQNVNYRIPAPAGLQNIVVSGDGKAKIDLTHLTPNAKIFYTTDGSTPSETSKMYEKPFEIELKPGEKIDFKTIVVNEKGRKSGVYNSTLWRRAMSSATDLKAPEAGALFRTFTQNFSSIDEMTNAQPENSGQTKSLGLLQFKDKMSETAPFAVEFEGFINVPADEIYEFEVAADDGAALWIDGEKVVNNDGVKEKPTPQSGIVPLRKGYHRFVLKYFKGQGKWALGVRWGVKGQPLRGLSANEIFRPVVMVTM